MFEFLASHHLIKNQIQVCSLPIDCDKKTRNEQLLEALGVNTDLLKLDRNKKINVEIKDKKIIVSVVKKILKLYRIPYQKSRIYLDRLQVKISVLSYFSQFVANITSL